MRKKILTRYLKTSTGFEIVIGNYKIGLDTVIFNMSSAHDCPSLRKELCGIGKRICYAYRDEKRWSNVKAYRKRQGAYWTNNNSDNIIRDFNTLFRCHKKIMAQIEYFRFNESGDFWNQFDVTKLSKIAKYLKSEYSIVTYGYTARSDLNFKDCDFLVKGSGHNKGNNGRTIVIKRSKDCPKNFVICPAHCKTCIFCKRDNGLNIAFVDHSNYRLRLKREKESN